MNGSAHVTCSLDPIRWRMQEEKWPRRREGSVLDCSPEPVVVGVVCQIGMRTDYLGTGKFTVRR